MELYQFWGLPPPEVSNFNDDAATVEEIGPRGIEQIQQRYR
jgi:hypothetical protein